jgi:hypothetical protein
VSPRVFFEDGARVSKRIPRRGARVSRISFQRGARVSKSFSEEEPVSPCCFGRGARVTNSFFQRGARVSHYFYLGDLVSLQFFLLGARVSKMTPEWSSCLQTVSRAEPVSPTLPSLRPSALPFPIHFSAFRTRSTPTAFQISRISFSTPLETTASSPFPL